ncbi:MAG: hypothetical protein K2P92_09270, partial [Bdellovibrionaceae bacterium]|nr:hypothetical protein [Pseudobdellovibrionaceae bacterium]
SGTVLSTNGAGALSWVTALSNNLASGTMWVGNGSGVAAPVTMAGDATISNSGVLTLGTVTVAKGGTGITSGTSGGIPYFASGSTMASSGVLASGGVVLGGGAGAAPTTVTGAANQVLRVPAGGGSPTFGAIELGQAAAVSGTLAVANGGTGVATTTRNFIFAGPAAANGAPLFRAAVSNDISNVGFVNGGNSFGATAMIGTADNQAMVFETNNVAHAILSATGTFSVSSDVTVGVPGTNNPSNVGNLQVNGQGYSKVVIDSTTGATLNWNANNGNTVRWISNTTGTTALTVTATNMQAGASYMLVVRAASTGAVSITCNGTAGKYVPANGSRVGGSATSKSVYTIMYDGEDCLVTWITGF